MENTDVAVEGVKLQIQEENEKIDQQLQQQQQQITFEVSLF